MQGNAVYYWCLLARRLKTCAMGASLSPSMVTNQRQSCRPSCTAHGMAWRSVVCWPAYHMGGGRAVHTLVKGTNASTLHLPASRAPLTQANKSPAQRLLGDKHPPAPKLKELKWGQAWAAGTHRGSAAIATREIRLCKTRNGTLCLGRLSPSTTLPHFNQHEAPAATAEAKPLGLTC